MEEMIKSPSPTSQPSSESSPGEVERWSSLITGGAMVLLGLQQRSLRGALLAIAGGGLTYHSLMGQKSLKDTLKDTVEQASEGHQSVRVEKTVSIMNRSAEELYQFWRNFENLPTFMKHLKSVTTLSPTRSHWIADAPLGNSVEWDADIIADEVNQLIAWASVEGGDIEHSGFVRFRPEVAGRGTEVKVVMEYRPPAGVVGVVVAKLLGEEPEQQIGDDLQRFKMLMETGEIATTEGQPSGRR